MKTIEISDEMYEKLVSLATEMTTQDMRCTAMPHMFQVQDKKRVYDWGMNGDHSVWLNSNHEREIEDYEDFLEYLERKEIKIPKKIKEIWGDVFDLQDFMRENCPDLKECTYSYDYIYTNCFFTAKGCQEHIKQNKHHYHFPVDYLNHAFRNPEMEFVSEFLCGLVKKEPHK